MSTTAIPARVRPHKALLPALGVVAVGVIATLSAVSLTDDDPKPASAGSPTATAAPAPVMSADAMERWNAGGAVDVRGMSPDAAERWLSGP